MASPMKTNSNACAGPSIVSGAFFTQKVVDPLARTRALSACAVINVRTQLDLGHPGSNCTVTSHFTVMIVTDNIVHSPVPSMDHPSVGIAVYAGGASSSSTPSGFTSERRLAIGDGGAIFNSSMEY